ncbi:aminotransferase class V-fold PLP-dependent enzyme [Streptomyces sp. TP-A0874]|uniref:aminotransferase class V-fold PLP-dependent enzyme n=1 Tax=Streptomyces sp. TP-A0874 TaxID=549819 RepID=UPI0008534670|nr:aminotransferase class V-fold PLP-dependent enzyme [Streptomyces sp. TP-A0874]
MDTGLGGAEFAPQTTYLKTAASGLLPARSAAVLRAAVDDAAAGRPTPATGFESVGAARESFARLVGVDVDRVAVAGSVSLHVGLIASALPTGGEILVADGDFSSLVNPFAVRRDLRLRTVPLPDLAAAVRPETTLVAVSAVQSADGRIADLAAIGRAARASGARTLVDCTQSAGWLPMCAADFDYTVAGGYKWLLCPRGVSFLTVPERHEDLPPLYAGWTAGEEPWRSVYGPIAQLARSARRFDQSPADLPYLAAQHSLALVEELGPERIGAHNRALADRFRAGAADLGHQPVAAPGSAIVAVPGLDTAEEHLRRAGVEATARAGNLRLAFHLYNTTADVDRVLDVLSDHR